MSDLLNSIAVAALASFSVMQVLINRRHRHRIEALERRDYEESIKRGALFAKSLFDEERGKP